MNWFEVDRAGLAKLLERRGKAFAVFEIISNAWDTNAKQVSVSFERMAGEPKARLIVKDDDPNGFTDLAHSFTLFAESEKKGKSEKRGRFNLGEKLVLAICTEAHIASTKGSVTFNAKGRSQSKSGTAKGSMVDCLLRMTKAEYDEALLAVRTLIPPADCETTLNGDKLAPPKLLHTFKAELPTEIADADGNLKRARRKTVVRVWEARAGEVPTLYELGVPVVETGDKWHVDVQQKVPLNMDRDNVPPAFLREVRTLVASELFGLLTKDDANQPWVREATSDKNCDPTATKVIMDLRFGEKHVAYDPSDPEANALAVTKGYTVVHGGMMNATEWDNAKKAGAILPAGKVTPSPKPYSEDGDPLKLVPEDKWTPGMKNIVAYAKALAPHLINRKISVRIASDIAWPFAATYGGGELTFNLGRLGHDWFKFGPTTSVNRLIIHEFGHNAESNHLDEGFHEALCELGARLADLAITKPGFFHEFFPEPS
jgi:hypothetical protein